MIFKSLQSVFNFHFTQHPNFLELGLSFKDSNNAYKYIQTEK